MEGNESGMCAALEKWRAQLLAARIAAASVCVGEAACVCMRERGQDRSKGRVRGLLGWLGEWRISEERPLKQAPRGLTNFAAAERNECPPPRPAFNATGWMEQLPVFSFPLFLHPLPPKIKEWKTFCHGTIHPFLSGYYAWFLLKKIHRKWLRHMYCIKCRME